MKSPSPHKEARQKRKELRQKLQAEQAELERQMKELQIANENKQKELETVRKVNLSFYNILHCRINTLAVNCISEVMDLRGL